ncbi:hypothetical protein Hanom_Chr05g00430351 [Helianthus anomalus]
MLVDLENERADKIWHPTSKSNNLIHHQISSANMTSYMDCTARTKIKDVNMTSYPFIAF